MSTKLAWQKLQKLVSFDKELLVIKKEIETTQNIVAEDEKLIAQLNESLQISNDECRMKKKQVDLAELKAKELKQEEDAKKQALNQTHNAKEYKAATKELRIISSKIIEQEDELVTAWGQLEQAEKKFKSEKQAFKTKIDDLNIKIAKNNKKILEMQQQLAAKNKERYSLVSIIPKETLDQYTRMRNKVDDPIVPVIRNTCSACFYTILLQDLNRLKKNEGMIHCKNCYRFLYYQPDEQVDSSQQNQVKRHKEKIS